MQLQDYLQIQIDKFKNNGFKREFIEINKIYNNLPYAMHKKEKVVVWCTNDYLGMSCNKVVSDGVENCIRQSGTGSGGSRNIAGTSSYHVRLEELIADLHKKESAMLFTSAFIANEALLKSFGSIENSIFFSDKYNHASIISGLKKGNCKVEVFEHNDTDHLYDLLKKYPAKTNKFIVFESVYSMDGDFSPIDKIIEMAEENNVTTILDEVNGVGLYGDRGGGVAEMFGLQDKIDLIIGTFGKAIGLFGGYITGKSTVIEYLKMFSSEFIFTTSLPTCIVAGAINSVEQLINFKDIRDRHQSVVKSVRRKLVENHFNLISLHSSHIVAVSISGVEKCKEFTSLLLNKYKIYIQPVFYPSVPIGQERLRITPTPYHTNQMVDELIYAMIDIRNFIFNL